MKIYFLSSTPCALTLNELYFGITDTFERFAEISLSDKIFVRFLPQNALPIEFFITEELRHTPPDGCEVYLLNDGIAVYARDFPPNDFSLRVFAQERFGDLLATVFSQGALQLSLESKKGAFVARLPLSLSKGKLSVHENLVFLSTQTHLAVFTKTGDCLLLEQIRAFSVEGTTLNATLPLSDSQNRVADCQWELSENECIRTKFTIRQPLEKTAVELTDELLPYAFFECVYVGGDFQSMLSDELLPNADKIKTFLGEFEGVTLTQDPHTCGLIRKKAERLFEVVYYTAETKDGKITDIALK